MNVHEHYAPLTAGTCGFALVVASVWLSATAPAEPTVAAVVGMVGFLGLAVGTILFVRPRVETFQRERAAAVTVVWLGIGLFSIGGVQLSGRVATVTAVVLGSGLAGAGYVWNRRLVNRKDVVTDDERTRRIRHRATSRAWQVTVWLALGLYAIAEFGRVRLAAADPAFGVAVVGVASRVAFAEYYRREM